MFFWTFQSQPTFITITPNPYLLHCCKQLQEHQRRIIELSKNVRIQPNEPKILKLKMKSFPMNGILLRFLFWIAYLCSVVCVEPIFFWSRIHIIFSFECGEKNHQKFRDILIRAGFSIGIDKILWLKYHHLTGRCDGSYRILNIVFNHE